MRILALDTTTDISSIGIADESGIIAQYDFAHKMDLSRRLMPNIVSMLKDVGMEVKDVEAVGVSIGPGSFTGLRIGVTTAKTLAQTLDIPIAGIVTLDLLAHQHDYLPDAVICPLIKVRKGEVYYAFFRTHEGSLERLSEYEAGPIEDVIVAGCQLPVDSRPPRSKGPVPLRKGDSLRSSPPCEGGVAVGRGGQSEIVFCGDALDANLPALKNALGGRVIPTPQSFSYPKAHDIARLALKRIAAGEADDPLTLVPFYIRRSAPEERIGDVCR